MELAALYRGQRVLHGVRHRGAEQIQRHQNDADGNQHDQRRGATVPVTQLALEAYAAAGRE